MFRSEGHFDLAAHSLRNHITSTNSPPSSPTIRTSWRIIYRPFASKSRNASTNWRWQITRNASRPLTSEKPPRKLGWRPFSKARGSSRPQSARASTRWKKAARSPRPSAEKNAELAESATTSGAASHDGIKVDDLFPINISRYDDLILEIAGWRATLRYAAS